MKDLFSRVKSKRSRVLISIGLAFCLSWFLSRTIFIPHTSRVNTPFLTSLPNRLFQSVQYSYKAISYRPQVTRENKTSQRSVSLQSKTPSDVPVSSVSPASSTVRQNTRTPISPSTALPSVISPTDTLVLPTTTSHVTSGSFRVGAGGKAPSVVVDSSDVAHFSFWDPQQNSVKHVSCQNGSTCTSEIQVSSSGVKAYYSSIALDQGKPVVAWQAEDASKKYAIYVSRLNGSQWSSQKISDETYAEAPSIASEGNGIIWVAYQSKGASSGVYVKKSNDGGATWDEGRKIGEGFWPRIDSDNGNTALVWFNSKPTYTVYYSYFTGGGWSDPIAVSSGNKDQTPDIALSADEAHIVWSYEKNGYNIGYKRYQKGKLAETKDGLAGDLSFSMWPKIAYKNGRSFIVFQGKTGLKNWDIYGIDTFQQASLISKEEQDEQNPDVDLGRGLTLIYFKGNEVRGYMK